MLVLIGDILDGDSSPHMKDLHGVLLITASFGNGKIAAHNVPLVAITCVVYASMYLTS